MKAEARNPIAEVFSRTAGIYHLQQYDYGTKRRDTFLEKPFIWVMSQLTPQLSLGIVKSEAGLVNPIEVVAMFPKLLILVEAVQFSNPYLAAGAIVAGNILNNAVENAALVSAREYNLHIPKIHRKK